jgi:peptidyl-prolyl cis-trans isomerase SurA
MNLPVRITFVFIILIFSLLQKPGHAQERVIIDQVVAVVGNSAILRSDLHNQQRQLESQGIRLGANPLCALLDEMLYQKLLFNQAVIDSVEVSDFQVEQVLERRLRFFIQQIGSREQLEAYYGKTIEELKDEFRPLVREQELSQLMEARITRNVRITPAEVRRFFNNIHTDSIPIVESETELAQIVIQPEVDPEELENTKNRLNEIRERILKGESFSTMAILYSEDPGSARKGGELGFVGRGELFTEFEATAFSLRPGEVSEIIETQAGFHVIQMIERRGEQINVRHILMQPEISPQQLATVRTKLDSIRTAIMNDEISFKEAALEFSTDPGKVNGGIMINPYTNTTRFKNEEIDQNLFFAVDPIEVGEITRPQSMLTDEGKQAFRIVKVKHRIDAHPASLDGDYDFIQQLALNEKKRKVVREWVNSKISSTYILINEEFRYCDFTSPWLDNVSTIH